MFWLTRRLAWSLPLAALIAASACSTAFEDSPFEEETGHAGISGTDGYDDEPDADDPAGTSGSPESTGGTGGGDTGDSAGDVEPLPSRPGPDHLPGDLYAGTWRDLDHWSSWNEVVGPNSIWKDAASTWGIETVGRRHQLTLVSDERPAIDLPVQLLDGDGDVVWEARTDNSGQVELFAAPHFDDAPDSVSLAIDGVPFDGAWDPASTESTTVELTEVPPPSATVDIMFLVDTTGSMGDELAYLQKRLGDVLSRVEMMSPDVLAPRLSVNFYRDDGEDYVLRSFPFTDDIDVALDQLGDQEAEGGGDIPEAVDRALSSAVAEHEWSESARARILFVVLDAPPHHDPESLARLHAATQEAARLGIRIVPVAGSATDETTAFLLRQLAVTTGSTYAFITEPVGLDAVAYAETIGDYVALPFDVVLEQLISDLVQ